MGGPRKLTVPQKQLIRELTVLREETKQSDQDIRDRAKRKLDEDLAHNRLKLDRKIFEAWDAGVPKSVMSTREVLGTTSPHRVNDAIKRIAGRQPNVTQVAAFEWLNEARKTVKVHYLGYPTANPDGDYPSILEGTVERGKSGWFVVEDKSDIPGEFGSIPGYLRYEVDRIGDSPEFPNIKTLLDEWVQVN